MTKPQGTHIESGELRDLPKSAYAYVEIDEFKELVNTELGKKLKLEIVGVSENYFKVDVADIGKFLKASEAHPTNKKAGIPKPQQELFRHCTSFKV